MRSSETALFESPPHLLQQPLHVLRPPRSGASIAGAEPEHDPL